MVLVTEDVAQDGILHVAGIGNQTHRHAGYGTLHLDAGVEQRQRAAAYGGHGRAAVRLQDIADDAAGVGEVVGEHALQGAVCQVAVTDLTTSHATLCLGLACGEGREVIVQQETLLALVQHIVHNLLVERGAEGGCHQGLGLATGEDSGSVRAGQIVHLAPDGTDLVGLAAVETDALVQNAAAHCLFLHVVVVTLHHGDALILGVEGQLLLGHLGEVGDVLVADGVERVHAPVLVGAAGLGYGVCLVVALLANVGAQCLVVYFVVVFALGLLAGFFLQLHHHLALLLDLLVSHLQGFEQLGLAGLVKLSLHHHDVVVGGAYHQFDIGLGYLVESGVYDPFAVDAGHTHLGDRAVEGDVAHSQGGRCGQTCQRVGSVVLVGREQRHVHKRLCMIVVGEKRTQHAVYKTGSQNLVVVATAFPLKESTGITSDGCVFFFVLYSQGHEVHALAGLAGRTYGCKQHRVAHAQLYSTVGLLGQLPGLQRDLTPVGQLDALLDWIHKSLLFRYSLISS